MSYIEFKNVVKEYINSLFFSASDILCIFEPEKLSGTSKKIIVYVVFGLTTPIFREKKFSY